MRYAWNDLPRTSRRGNSHGGTPQPFKKNNSISLREKPPTRERKITGTAMAGYLHPSINRLIPHDDGRNNLVLHPVSTVFPEATYRHWHENGHTNLYVTNDQHQSPISCNDPQPLAIHTRCSLREAPLSIDCGLGCLERGSSEISSCVLGQNLAMGNLSEGSDDLKTEMTVAMTERLHTQAQGAPKYSNRKI